MKLPLAILLLALLVGCTRPDSAKRVLEGAGYSNIRITGYCWFSCSEDDSFATGFTATGPTGKFAKGCVCEGIVFKNATIRFE